MALFDRIKKSKEENISLFDKIKRSRQTDFSASTSAIEPTTFVPPRRTDTIQEEVTSGVEPEIDLKPFNFARATEEQLTKRKEDVKTVRSDNKLKEVHRKKTLTGAEERLDNLLKEAKLIEDSPEPDFTKQRDLTKDILEARNLVTANQPGFKSGVRESLGFEPTAKFGAQLATPERQLESESAIEEARGQKGFTTGRVGGEIAKQAALYSTVGTALRGTQFFKGLATKLGGGKVATFASGQIAELFVDAVIQTPQEVLRSDTIKTIGWNRLLDIGLNLGIGASGEYFKSLKSTDPQGLETAIKNMSPEQANQVRQALDTTPKALGITQPSPDFKPKTLFDRIQESKGVETDTLKQVGTTQPFKGVPGLEVPKLETLKGVEPSVTREPIKSIAEDIQRPREEVFETTLDAVESQQKGGDANTFRQKIVRDAAKKEKKTFAEVLEKFDTQFIDDTAPFKKVEKQILGKIGSAEESISKQARLFKGAPEAANEILRTELKPAIQIAEKAGFNHKDLGDYALAVHAKDVNDAGLKSGFSDAEIADTIRKLGTEEMERARTELVKVSDRLLDMMKEDGLLSQESLTALKSKWTNYMPLFRSFDDTKVEFSKGISDSFSNVTAPIKKLVGSDREVLDPIESMVKNIYKTVDATRRNRVGTQLAKLSDIDVDNKFIRKLDQGELVGRKNVVNATIDGQKVPFEVEPELFKAFNNLDKESSNTLINILSKPASLLRAGATLTPEFALRNPLRDIQNAFVVSKSGFNPITDFAAGLASTMKKGDLYQQWLKEGGGYGNILSMDRQAHKEAIESVIKQPVTKQFVNAMSPKGMLDMLRGISDITESATKVGEFRAALRSGATPAEAAFRSRDLMDFARAGSSIRPANKVVAFLNANIQGKSKLLRAIKENPKGVSAKLATSMALPSIGAYAFTQKFGNDKQKATIKDAPDWMKNTFWLIPIPGSDLVARMPKPFDISFAANGTERFLDYALENDKEAFDDFLGQTIKDQSIPVMLTGILPIIEGLANHSFFRQGPIVPRREEFLKREDQFDSRTSELAKLIAKPARALLGEESNLSSPRTMDYILRSSTGGLGSSILDGTDAILDKLGVTDKPAKPKPSVTQLPLIKGFTVNELSTGKSLGELYDLRTQLQREKGSAKLEGGKLNPKDQNILDLLNKKTKAISDISKKMREITESKNIDAENKKAMLKQLVDARNKLARDTMKRVGK